MRWSAKTTSLGIRQNRAESRPRLSLPWAATSPSRSLLHLLQDGNVIHLKVVGKIGSDVWATLSSKPVGDKGTMKVTDSLSCPVQPSSYHQDFHGSPPALFAPPYSPGQWQWKPSRRSQLREKVGCPLQPQNLWCRGVTLTVNDESDRDENDYFPLLNTSGARLLELRDHAWSVPSRGTHRRPRVMELFTLYSW